MRARDVLLAFLIILGGMAITAHQRGVFAELRQRSRSLDAYIQQEGLSRLLGLTESKNGWWRVDVSNRRVSATGIREIIVESASGDVKVRSHTVMGGIGIEALRWARGDNYSAAAKNARAVNLSVSQVGDRLLISDTGPKNFWKNASLDIYVSAPSRLAVSVKAVAGKVFIEDLYGGAKAATVSGDITIYGGAYGSASSESGNLEVAGIRGPTTARSVSGNLNLYDNQGETKASTVSGTLHIGDQNGRLEASSVSGDIDIGYYAGPEAVLKTTSGKIAAKMEDASSGKFTAKSVSGNIRLALPSDSDCTIDLNSPGGSVSTTLPLLQQTQQHGRLRGTLGAGRGAVMLGSVSGNIEVIPPED